MSKEYFDRLSRQYLDWLSKEDFDWLFKQYFDRLPWQYFDWLWLTLISAQTVLCNQYVDFFSFYKYDIHLFPISVLIF